MAGNSAASSFDLQSGEPLTETRVPMRELQLEALDIFLRLCAAGLLGVVIGFERRVHHKAIGIAGMMLISIGSTTYMLLGRHLAKSIRPLSAAHCKAFCPESAFSGAP